MNVKIRSIEVDTATADLLEARATARGMSVSELVAELASRDNEPVAIDAAEVAELDRRWTSVAAGRPTVPHDEVVRWLETWGTSSFTPWRER